MGLAEQVKRTLKDLGMDPEDAAKIRRTKKIVSRMKGGALSSRTPKITNPFDTTAESVSKIKHSIR